MVLSNYCDNFCRFLEKNIKIYDPNVGALRAFANLLSGIIAVSFVYIGRDLGTGNETGLQRSSV